MIVAIVVLFFGIDYLKGINIFNPANFYYINCKNVQGLEISAPVSINGFKVGQVRELSYDYENPGEVKVLLAVNKQLHIPTDSYAVLSSTLMGGGFVDIKMGDSKTMLPVGSVIEVKNVPSLMEALSDNVMPAVNTILPRIDSLLYNLNTLVADPALAQSINRLDGITGNLLATSGGLNTTMNKDVPLVMRNVHSITYQVDSICGNLGALSYSLKQLPLATTVDNVNQVTDNLIRFSDQLNNQTSTLGKLTNDPELYNRLNRVAADVDSLIVDIKKNPKRYISIKLL